MDILKGIGGHLAPHPMIRVISVRQPNAPKSRIIPLSLFLLKDNSLTKEKVRESILF